MDLAQEIFLATASSQQEPVPEERRVHLIPVGSVRETVRPFMNCARYR